MPRKPLSPCRRKDCPDKAIKDGFCLKHSKEYHRELDQDRPSAAARGYGYRWQIYSRIFLAHHPFCIRCGQPSTEVDHILSVMGANDILFWDPKNHQSLCKSCHSSKTFKEVSGRDERRGDQIAGIP